MAEKFNQPPPYTAQNQGPVYPDLNQPIGSAYGQYPGWVDPQMNQGQPQQPQPAIIINRTKFGPFPARATCQICRSEVLTETHTSSGLLAWLLSGACCLVGCWAGCCLIPFCVDACNDVVHKCPNCKAEIALYKRL